MNFKDVSSNSNFYGLKIIFCHSHITAEKDKTVFKLFLLDFEHFIIIILPKNWNYLERLIS